MKLSGLLFLALLATCAFGQSAQEKAIQQKQLFDQGAISKAELRKAYRAMHVEEHAENLARLVALRKVGAVSQFEVDLAKARGDSLIANYDWNTAGDEYKEAVEMAKNGAASPADVLHAKSAHLSAAYNWQKARLCVADIELADLVTKYKMGETSLEQVSLKRKQIASHASAINAAKLEMNRALLQEAAVMVDFIKAKVDAGEATQKELDEARARLEAAKKRN